jgi:hypothetical protein
MTFFDSVTSLRIENLSLWIEIIAAIVGSIYFYKYKETYLKYFLIFLWYIAFNELLGRYLAEILGEYNLIIFNLYLLINFPFLFSIYRHFINNKLHRRIIFYFIYSYILIFILNGIFFEDYEIELVTYPFIIGSSFLIISVIFYFIEVLNSEKILNITRNLLFWISVGVLLFNIGIIPWIITLEYFAESIDTVNVLSRALIIILNICYIIGFIWSHKMKESE